MHLNHDADALTRLAPRIVTRDRARLKRVIKINCRYKDREASKFSPLLALCPTCAFISVTKEEENSPLMRQNKFVLDPATDCNSRGDAPLPRDNVMGQRRPCNYDDLSIGVRAIRVTRVDRDVRDVQY